MKGLMRFQAGFGVACATVLLLSSGTGAIAQSAPSVSEIIVANAATPKKICSAIKPVVYATPASASEVIASAESQPDLLEPLCECLSETQTALKGTDPEGAKIVGDAVATSSPAFQACYAVALSPGETGGGTTQVVTSEGAGSSGGGGAPYSPGGSGGSGGFGGGPVSPN